MTSARSNLGGRIDSAVRHDSSSTTTTSEPDSNKKEDHEIENDNSGSQAASGYVSCEDVPTQPRLIIRLPFAVPTRPPEA